MKLITLVCDECKSDITYSDEEECPKGWCCLIVGFGTYVAVEHQRKIYFCSIECRKRAQKVIASILGFTK